MTQPTPFSGELPRLFVVALPDTTFENRYPDRVQGALEILDGLLYAKGRDLNVMGVHDPELPTNVARDAYRNMIRVLQGRDLFPYGVSVRGLTQAIKEVRRERVFSERRLSVASDVCEILRPQNRHDVTRWLGEVAKVSNFANTNTPTLLLTGPHTFRALVAANADNTGNMIAGSELVERRDFGHNQADAPLTGLMVLARYAGMSKTPIFSRY